MIRHLLAWLLRPASRRQAARIRQYRADALAARETARAARRAGSRAHLALRAAQQRITDTEADHGRTSTALDLAEQRIGFLGRELRELRQLLSIRREDHVRRVADLCALLDDRESVIRAQAETIRQYGDELKAVRCAGDAAAAARQAAVNAARARIGLPPTPAS